MKQYLALLQDILDNGTIKQDRTGTGTISVFGRQMRFDLGKGFPLVTTKKLHLKSIIHEVVGFSSCDTSIRYLQSDGVGRWEDGADKNGNKGEVYGKQWRSWLTDDGQAVDQLANVVEQIKQDPDSRRHLVSAWNVAKIEQMALPPCHYVYQFYVADGKLSCLFNMRSIDCFLGLPFNIASYALLTFMVAQQCNLNPGELIWTGGDVHLYLNHLEQTRLQLTREPYPLPELQIIRKPESLFKYRYEDFVIKAYQSHPHIKAVVAV